MVDLRRKPHTAEHNAKIGAANRGRKMSEEARRKMSLAKKGKPAPHRSQEKNPVWKGEDVGYQCLHAWVRKYKPNPGKCVRCTSTNCVRASNVSGSYKRELSDYEYLCQSCHSKNDKSRGPSVRFKELMTVVVPRDRFRLKE